jgi:hypothetical protein
MCILIVNLLSVGNLYVNRGPGINFMFAEKPDVKKSRVFVKINNRALSRCKNIYLVSLSRIKNSMHLLGILEGFSFLFS